MLRIGAGAALVLVLASAAAPAAAAGHALKFLTPADVRPEALLPPPPADGSPRALAELAEVRALSAGAGPERRAQAQWDDANEDGTIFRSAIAPGFDLKALPATARLLAEVREEEAVAGGLAKTYFKRNRPWVLDPKLKTCSREDAPQSSYPSGHTTMAFSMAVVLAAAMPEASQQLMTRARDYAESRVICAAHFRSDTTAGEALGTAVATMLLRNEEFREDLAAAHAELVAAHLTAEP
ncbi:MAG TPA: phosphatase PAP2 family protein [Caulobacteraceae bacterium]|nr:phosphatase PAP2 family protein [Caulobacteraceae bacterium]